MTEEEKLQLVSEYDDDLFFDDFDNEEELPTPKIRTDYSEFMMWFEAMKKRLDISKMQKALFCRRLCTALKNDCGEDMKRLWCLCLSEHSDFLFDRQGDTNDTDYAEYRSFNFAMLIEDIEGYMRRLENESANVLEFMRLAENITFQKEPLTEIKADSLASAMTEVYGISGENYKDNMRKICGKISCSPELSKIVPNVLYSLFMRYRKKLTDNEDFLPNFKSALRKMNYIIDIDNGKNQAVYEEHLDVYENLCACFENCDKSLCDAGFSCMSNLCENEILPWEDYPDFERPIETELLQKYFTCFPGGLDDKRDIPLVSEATAVIKRQLEIIESDKEIAGMAYNDYGFIFANAIGQPFDQRTYADHFNRIVAAAGIEKVIQLGTNDVSVGFHTLRHTFATRAVENGMDILVLSRILGHSSPTTTLNKYGHVLYEHMKSSMEKIRPVKADDTSD